MTKESYLRDMYLAEGIIDMISQHKRPKRLDEYVQALHEAAMALSDYCYMKAGKK